MIEVSDLTVRFGGVTPLDEMSVKFDSGTCGLIGPNGAGKTTFFNVLSGFVKPVGGSVVRVRRRPAGDHALSPRPMGRAPDLPDRAGDRGAVGVRQRGDDPRELQDERVLAPPGRARSDRVRRLDIDPAASVGTLGAAQRRLVELARAVVGRPRLVLLDEPAAGLPDEETGHMGEVIRRIPEQTGAMTILVDHDMSLVSACCEVTAVLDFGKMIASGPTAEVLRDERVIRAYLGTEEVGVTTSGDVLRIEDWSSRAAGATSSAGSRSRFPPARSPRCSGPTAPASRAWCSRSAGC